MKEPLGAIHTGRRHAFKPARFSASVMWCIRLPVLLRLMLNGFNDFTSQKHVTLARVTSLFHFKMHCTGVAPSHLCVMCLACRLYYCLQTEKVWINKYWLQGIITGIIMEVLKTPMWCFVPISHAATAGFIHDQWLLDSWRQLKGILKKQKWRLQWGTYNGRAICNAFTIRNVKLKGVVY